MAPHDAKRLPSPDNAYLFSAIILAFEVLMIVLYIIGTDYQDAGSATAGASLVAYPMYQDVNSMIFLGFGFLMCFLARYAWTSLGMTFLLSAMSIQWSILVNHFAHSVVAQEAITVHSLSVYDLITGDFAAGAVLISFGAVLGRTGPTQLLVMMILELIFYAFNEAFGAGEFLAIDVGGSMFVHTFGAYFGLAVSFMIGNAEHLSKQRAAGAAQAGQQEESTDEAQTSKAASSFAMLGTMILWMFWPSFNGALATGAAQERVFVNTILSIAGSCIAAFMVSRVLRGGKLSMEDVQNATLAGGVAIGSAADLLVGPGVAIAIGFLAGCLSVVGYVYISPFLAASLGLDDTCGVHNLHGMPGIMGGLAGAIAAAAATESTYGSDLTTIWAGRHGDGEGRSAGEQAGFQVAALALTLLFAIGGGLFTGAVIRLDVFGPVTGDSEAGAGLYEDERNWDMSEVADAAEGHPGAPYAVSSDGGHAAVSESTRLTHRSVALKTQSIAVRGHGSQKDEDTTRAAVPV